MSVAVHVQLGVRDAAAASGIAALLAHTPRDVPLVIEGPEAGDARAWLDALAGSERLRLPPAPAHAAGDLAVVDARTLVPPDWLAQLQAAAQAVPGPVATVSPLAIAAPEQLGANGVELDTAAAAVRRHTVLARPRITAPCPACMLVAHAALELAGPLDEGFPGRCSAAGLLHIVADDVLVAVPGDAAVARSEDDLEPLGRVSALARRAVGGLSVTIDGRALSGSMAGTQVHALELTAALHRTGAARLRVVVPPDLLPEAAALFATLEGLELLPALAIDSATPRSEIVHRPYQVSSTADAQLLRRVARRRVITHQDLLGYHNPGYHPSASQWESHRRLTRATLAAADLVVAFSGHVADGLLAEDLVDPSRLEMIRIGVDHRLPRLAPPAAPPERSEPLTRGPFLLCLGTALRHKNRPFALALFGALRDRGWDGRLALAGPPAAAGSSQAAETDWLERNPEHATAVVDLGPVDESGKAWLYANAAAVLYPTTSEGFGLIPFEAAAAGTPCLHAGGSALDELLPGSATLVSWDAAASAEQVLAVLRDRASAATLAARVAGAGSELTWDRTAERLVACYEAALRRPPSPAGFTAWMAIDAEERLAELERGRALMEQQHRRLVETIGPTGLSLVGHDRLLPENAQRVIAGLARRPLTRKPLLRVLSTLHRVAARR